jgi:hypothetical protein
MLCDVFSISETIHFESLEFITDRFDGVSLSPMGDSSGATVMGSTHSKTPSPLRAMTGDSVEEFHTASNGEAKGTAQGIQMQPPQPYRG